MAASVPHTILLKGEWEMIQNEGVAGGTIRPGDLVSVTTAGAIVVNPTAADPFPRKAFALEDDAQGRGIADSYAAADRVRYAECQPGDEIYAWLATAQTITIGAPLESAGGGPLRLRAATGAAIATALEAITTTASQSRIKVRVS